MEKHGIDIQKYQENGSLILVRGEDLYKSEEKPDLENCKTAVKSVIEGFMAKGKKGVRVAGDLTSYFLPRGLMMQWFDLEQLFERQSTLPLTVICAYNALYTTDKGP